LWPARPTAATNAGGGDGERGGRVPMGYTRIMGAAGATGEIAIDPEAAAVVRAIFQRRAAGATLGAIADALNGDGVSTRRGGRWHASSVREVLLNEADYRGGRRGESGLCWPAILA
jgi:hypothetical protein